MVKPTLVSNSIRAHRESVGLTQAELGFQIARAFGVGIDDVFQYPEPSTKDA
jgi:putative transcriptional regulator